MKPTPLRWIRAGVVAGIVAATASMAEAQSPPNNPQTIAQAEFGLRLLERWAAEHPSTANVLVSPASIAATFAFWISAPTLVCMPQY